MKQSEILTEIVANYIEETGSEREAIAALLAATSIALATEQLTLIAEQLDVQLSGIIETNYFAKMMSN